MKLLHNERFKNKALQTYAGEIYFDENSNAQVSEDMMELLVGLEGFTRVNIQEKEDSKKLKNLAEQNQ